jgi:3-hydroxybutyryl-CoA dehydrogenase
MGYVLARIQVLAMNEAARLVQEGVASVEDVDTAVRVGFGLRFSVLGPLEFADWGGVDILHRASAVMVRQLQDERFAAPPIVAALMAGRRRGLQDGEGFYKYAGVDQNSYREKRLEEFIELLRLRRLMPVFQRGDSGSGPAGGPIKSMT